MTARTARAARAARVAVLAASALAGMLLSACSGSGGSAGSSGSAASSMTAASSVTMSMPAGGSAPMPMSSSVSMSSVTGSGTDSSAAMSGEVIHIKDFQYSSLTVSPGATVMVHNMDQTAHTVTSDQSGLFNVNVPAGSMATFTAPKTPGKYAYHCIYHGNMHGVLTVS